jgi:phosphate-selective porin OprO/OprP
MDIVGLIAASALLTLLESPPAAGTAMAPPRAAAGRLFDTETAPQSDKEKSPEKKPQRFRWDEHPSIHFAKGTHIDFRARFQGDIRAADEAIDKAAEENDGLDIARRRVGVEGELLGRIDYQVEAELGSEDLWRDVYASFRYDPALAIQGGHFKLPFSLDELTSATNLDFVYRSRAANQLAPGRDVGVMAHGRVFRRMIGYEGGVFTHDGRNARTRDSDRVYGDRTFAGRVTFQPFRPAKDWRTDLQVGVAMTTSQLALGESDLRGHTSLDLRFFRPDVWVEGERRRLGLELRWRPGPFSIKSEYMRVTDERLGQSVEDTDLSPLVSSGWYLSGTWALTGEAKAEGLDTPRRPLFRGGFGAVEVAARLERLAFGSAAHDEVPSDGPRANVIVGNSDVVQTYGINWYVMRWVKIQLNLMRDSIADPTQGPVPGQPVFWSRVLRFQLSL